MNSWVPINAKELDAGQEETRKGVHFKISPSPYDIPEAVRGYYSDKDDRFVIEFKYMTDEVLTDCPLTDHVSARIGKHSGRIYALCVDVNAIKVEQVILSVESVKNALLKAAESSSICLGQNEVRRNANNLVLKSVQPELIPEFKRFVSA